MSLRKWVRRELGSWNDFLYLVGILVMLLIAPFYMVYLVIKEILFPQGDRNK